MSSSLDAAAGIRVRDLTKTFWVARHRRGALGALRGLVDRSGREVQAVAGISFDLAPGEIVGYVGPNGAGKSTTIKMLTGILVPSSGEATVAGLTPWRERKALARKIGVVFGQRTQLWWDLPLIESLDLLRHVYAVPAERHRENLCELRALLDLDPFLETPVRQLSLGQRMRGDLAAALLHDPAILYLDEPTIGLDVVAKARVREFLQRINRENGVTIILTTHDLADVEHLCRRMMIIDHGRLIYDGGIEEIRRRFGTHRTLIVDLEAGDESVADEAPCLVPVDLTADDLVQVVRSDGPRFWLRFDRQRVNPAELISAVASAHEVRDVVIEEPEIEDIVRRIYEEGIGEAALPPGPSPVGGSGE
ncbi:MAG: viologen exporter family transport system ATP-binding protein, partial [Thermomicrobiales bacterium]|nr:viologen exporter family transport system ATP-binding protein [Thermomicrobiales bacterium]